MMRTGVSDRAIDRAGEISDISIPYMVFAMNFIPGKHKLRGRLSPFIEHLNINE